MVERGERVRANIVAGSAITFVVCAGLGFGMSRALAAQEAVFTAAQAEAGLPAYRTHCAGCHASDLGGRDDAPALAGPDFLKTWGPRTTADLHEFVSTTMPPDGTTLTPEEYLAVIAFMLSRNGAAAGTTPLAADTAVGIATLVGTP